MLELEVVPEHSLGNDTWEFVLYMNTGGISDELSVKKPKSLPESKISKLISKHTSSPSGSPSPPTVSILEDDVEMKSDESSRASSDSRGSPGLEIVDDYNKCFVCNCGTLNFQNPGIYNNEKQTFTLTFRGLSFMFHIDAQYQPSMLDDKLGSLQFLDGCSPVVSKILIYSENDSKNNPEHPIDRKEVVEILREKNETLGLNITSLNVKIFFGDTCQDVCTTLGAPNKIFFKAEDKMKIHSPNAHKLVTGQRKSDFFFNYFTLGLDILFDASTYRAKKFVLHTNYPGHYNFNTYHRCQFILNMNDVHINAYSKWNEINGNIEASEQPVVLSLSYIPTILVITTSTHITAVNLF
ncbi:UPF0183 protein C16orf70-like [Diaphorina citri]|uniref:UPF0183 protein C16orf70-like n=1 Tax=Diaphorina citri TaxID=121845 RepID=A0A3Q0IXY1_DIACI|nr:UPF0183 protein C16orf70-like [Diaphorina citri]